MTPGSTTKRKVPTIFDVAEQAGVSKSTVSNVVRGSAGVAVDTRRRVQQAIESLGYRPNTLARQFVHQRTTILGVLVGDLNNPFYAEMAKRVEQHAFAHHYTAMLCNIEGDADFALSRIEALVEQHVAGVIFLAYFGSSSDIQAALDGKVPVMFASMREKWSDSISVADNAGAQLAIQHLIDLGHRRISYFASRHLEPRASRARHAGYQAVLGEAGLAAGPPVYWEAPSERGRTAQDEVELLRLFTGRHRQTAVLCANDLQAIDLIEFADRHGLRVPEDLSIVGFDDVHLAGLARLSLTTVRQPFDELAQIAVATVLGRIEGSILGRPRHRVLEPSLVVRQSTAPPAVR